MCTKLRKVAFRLNYQHGYEPNLNSKEQEEREEQNRERNGYFHNWASVTDNNKDVSYRVNEVGIVEEEDTGQVYCVAPDLIKFNEPPYEEV